MQQKGGLEIFVKGVARVGVKMEHQYLIGKERGEEKPQGTPKVC